MNGYGLGDLVQCVNSVFESDIEKLVSEYKETYTIPNEATKNEDQFNMIKEAAKVGMKCVIIRQTFLKKRIREIGTFLCDLSALGG